MNSNTGYLLRCGTAIEKKIFKCLFWLSLVILFILLWLDFQQTLTKLTSSNRLFSSRLLRRFYTAKASVRREFVQELWTGLNNCYERVIKDNWHLNLKDIIDLCYSIDPLIGPGIKTNIYTNIEKKKLIHSFNKMEYSLQVHQSFLVSVKTRWLPCRSDNWRMRYSTSYVFIKSMFQYNVEYADDMRMTRDSVPVERHISK